jgi:hypothetical protein
MIPPTNASDDEKMQYFRNIRAGKHPLENTVSLDYSLQLGIGIRNFPGAAPQPGPMGVLPPVTNAIAMVFADQAPTKAGQDEETSPREGIAPEAPLKFAPVNPKIDGDPNADEKPDVEEASDSTSRSPTIWIVGLLAVAALAVVILLFWRSGSKAQK